MFIKQLMATLKLRRKELRTTKVQVADKVGCHVALLHRMDTDPESVCMDNFMSTLQVLKLLVMARTQSDQYFRLDTVDKFRQLFRHELSLRRLSASNICTDIHPNTVERVVYSDKRSTLRSFLQVADALNIKLTIRRERIMIPKEGVVLVDFWSTNCGPCKMMLPVVNKVEDEFGDTIKVVKVTREDQPDVFKEYQVINLPTFIVFKDGQEVARLSGVLTKKSLGDAVQTAL